MITVATAPDQGLPVEFLEAAAEALNARLPAAGATVEYPGILCFDACGERWATGLTGLHTCDMVGDGRWLAGDDPVVALEQAGEVTLGEYVERLAWLIAGWQVEWNAGAWALLTPDGRIYSEREDGEVALRVAALYNEEGKVV